MNASYLQFPLTIGPQFEFGNWTIPFHIGFYYAYGLAGKANRRDPGAPAGHEAALAGDRCRKARGGVVRGPGVPGGGPALPGRVHPAGRSGVANTGG